MILSDFLSRQKHDNSNPHEIIPISFIMQSILQTRYYNLGKGSPVKYLVLTQSQAKSSVVKLWELHGIGKGLDPNVQPEKQVIKPIVNTKMKEVSQIKSGNVCRKIYIIRFIIQNSHHTKKRDSIVSHTRNMCR